jgi:general secretion pathway protein E
LPPPPTRAPVDWRRLVDWAREDGLITADEASAPWTAAPKAESVQHPLVRLASVSMRRASDDRRWTSSR